MENGQSGYTIVVAADAPPPVKFAAEEFQKYVAQISGARLPLATNPTGDLTIYVGEASIPTGERDQLRADLKDRGEDGYVMRSLGKRLVLTGNSPRATLYAVYHFLEKYLGCGWCVPGDDTVPRQVTIGLSQFHDAVGPPAFSMRQIILYPYANNQYTAGFVAGKTVENNLARVDWMAKNRFNWVHPAPNGPGGWEAMSSREKFVPEVKKRGLYLEVGGHTFRTWLPGSAEAICLSRPDALQKMAKNIIKWLDENPEVDVVDLWHNDTDADAYCRCPKCTPNSAGASERDVRLAYTKTYIRFTNQVAAQVSQRHPKVLVNLLAYGQTTNCPTDGASLSDNVLVGLCLFPRWTQRTMRPVETSPQELDANLSRQIPAWRKLSKHFYIYEYYSFGDAGKFWSMVSMLCQDIRFFQRQGVDGISSDQYGSERWYPLNLYAFGRLMLNPALTPEEIIVDFCHRYYGKASAPMIVYWNLLEEGLRESWNTNSPVNWRDQERIVQIKKALSQAESKAVQNRIRAIAAMHLLTINE